MATPRTRNRFAGQGDRISDSGTQKWLNIFGDVQIINNLENLKTSMQRKVLRKAILKGVRKIAKVARRKVKDNSYDTGLLYSSIKSTVTKMVSGKVYVDPKVVGPNGEKPAKYAHLVEFGSIHNNAEAFMRPALDESRGEVLGEIQQTAKEEMKKLEASKWR